MVFGLPFLTNTTNFATDTPRIPMLRRVSFSRRAVCKRPSKSPSLDAIRAHIKKTFKYFSFSCFFFFFPLSSESVLYLIAGGLKQLLVQLVACDEHLGWFQNDNDSQVKKNCQFVSIRFNFQIISNSFYLQIFFLQTTSMINPNEYYFFLPIRDRKHIRLDFTLIH